jgi:hypothetical protein
VTNRVRVAAPRKRGGAKRPPKKATRRRPGILLLVALAVVILGFLARRVMLPSAVHYLAHRPPDRPLSDVESPATTGDQPNAATDRDENPTNSDREELDSILKKAK